jgi:hypothetical protein
VVKGIPSDPHLTNEYYKNFEDFEMDESPERNKQFTRTSSFNRNNANAKSTTINSLSKTMVPHRPPASNRARTAMSPKKPINVTNSKPTVSKNVNGGGATASKTFSGSRPRQSVATRIEYEQLIDVMQHALSNNKSDRKFCYLASNTFKIELVVPFMRLTILFSNTRSLSSFWSKNALSI